MNRLVLTLGILALASVANAVDLKAKYGYVVIEPEPGTPGAQLPPQEIITKPGAAVYLSPVLPDGTCSKLPNFQLYPSTRGTGAMVHEFGTLKRTGPTDNPPCALVVPTHRQQIRAKKAVNAMTPSIMRGAGTSDSEGRGMPMSSPGLPPLSVGPQSKLDEPQSIDPVGSCIAARQLVLSMVDPDPFGLVGSDTVRTQAGCGVWYQTADHYTVPGFLFTLGDGYRWVYGNPRFNWYTSNWWGQFLNNPQHLACATWQLAFWIYWVDGTTDWWHQEYVHFDVYPGRQPLGPCTWSGYWPYGDEFICYGTRFLPC